MSEGGGEGAMARAMRNSTAEAWPHERMPMKRMAAANAKDRKTQEKG